MLRYKTLVRKFWAGSLVSNENCPGLAGAMDLVVIDISDRMDLVLLRTEY